MKASELPVVVNEKRCFVAMPDGRVEDEQVWFRGWFKEVIETAIKQAGYTVELSTVKTAPTFITDEIRQHLAQDEMAVFDLRGVAARRSSQPERNV